MATIAGSGGRKTAKPKTTKGKITADSGARRATAPRAAKGPAKAIKARRQSRLSAEHDADPALRAGAVRVLRKFRVVFNAVKSHFRALEKKAGVGGASVWALSVIRAYPGIGVTALARAMSIRQPTASNLVKGLVARDMVAQSRVDGVNGVELRIRPAGVRVLRKAPGPYSGVLPAALDSLDDKTLARLNRDLESLIAVLGIDESADGTPLADI